MKDLVKIFSVVAFYFAMTNTTFGCSCFGVPVSDGFKSAGAVFIGKIVSAGEFDSNRFKFWEVEVNEVWKGDVTKKIKLYSHVAITSSIIYCDPDFTQGANYIFFVDNKSQKTAFTTIPCNWTTESSKWKKVLKKWDKEKFWKKLGKGDLPLEDKNKKTT